MSNVVQMRPRKAKSNLALFLERQREAADLELRRVVCGHCERESPLLDGPKGRMWWAHHINNVCKGRPA